MSHWVTVKYNILLFQSELFFASVLDMSLSWQLSMKGSSHYSALNPLMISTLI